MAVLQAPGNTKDLTSLFQRGLFNQVSAGKEASLACIFSCLRSVKGMKCQVASNACLDLNHDAYMFVLLS